MGCTSKSSGGRFRQSGRLEGCVKCSVSPCNENSEWTTLFPILYLLLNHLVGRHFVKSDVT